MACKEAGRALAEVLKTSSVLKELDVSSNHNQYVDGAKDGPGFAEELAAGLSANGALTSLNISNNKLTRGVLKSGKSGRNDSDFWTDMTGQ